MSRLKKIFYHSPFAISISLLIVLVFFLLPSTDKGTFFEALFVSGIGFHIFCSFFDFTENSPKQKEKNTST